MPYREKDPSVYILASKRNGTPYTGVTTELPQCGSSMNPEWIDRFDENTSEVFDGPAVLARRTRERTNSLTSALVSAWSRERPVGHSRRRDDGVCGRERAATPTVIPSPRACEAWTRDQDGTQYS